MRLLATLALGGLFLLGDSGGRPIGDNDRAPGGGRYTGEVWVIHNDGTPDHRLGEPHAPPVR